jgi:EmrB/QacA subfamily drug resistance transporter
MNQHTNYYGLLVTGLSIAIFMSSLDTSVVNVVLPTLVTVLHTSFAGVQWVVLSYLLVVASFIVGAGKLGDVIGKKSLYIGGLAVFTMASALCGMSTGIVMLVLSRALQGTGAAVLMALGFAIAQECVTREKILRSMTILTAMVSLGFAVGPTLGGMLINIFGWQSIFYINVPLGIVAIILLARAIPASFVKSKSAFDWKGTLALAITLAAYVCAMTLSETMGFTSELVLLLFVVSVIGLLIFIWLQSWIKHPLIALGMFKDRLLSTSLLTSVFVYSNLMCAQILASFFLARVDGLSESKIGIALSAGPLATTILGFVGGALAKRFGPRKIMVIGVGIMAIGSLLMSTLEASGGMLGFILRIAIINGGLALFQTPNNAVVMGAAKPDQRGVVSGLLALGRSLGQITGASVMSSLFAIFVIGASRSGAPVGTAESAALIIGYHKTFLVIVFLMIVATIIAAFGAKHSVKPQLQLDKV